jgi:hypothetical protein
VDERKRKRAIRIKIHDTIEKHCIHCQYQKGMTLKPHKLRSEYCEKCNAYKEIRELGDSIVPPYKIQKGEKKMTKDNTKEKEKSTEPTVPLAELQEANMKLNEVLFENHNLVQEKLELEAKIFSLEVLLKLEKKCVENERKRADEEVKNREEVTKEAMELVVKNIKLNEKLNEVEEENLELRSIVKRWA